MQYFRFCIWDLYCMEMILKDDGWFFDGCFPAFHADLVLKVWNPFRSSTIKIQFQYRYCRKHFHNIYNEKRFPFMETISKSFENGSRTIKKLYRLFAQHFFVLYVERLFKKNWHMWLKMRKIKLVFSVDRRIRLSVIFPKWYNLKKGCSNSTTVLYEQGTWQEQVNNHKHFVLFCVIVL